MTAPRLYERGPMCAARVFGPKPGDPWAAAVWRPCARRAVEDGLCRQHLEQRRAGPRRGDGTKPWSSSAARRVRLLATLTVEELRAELARRQKEGA